MTCKHSFTKKDLIHVNGLRHVALIHCDDRLYNNILILSLNDLASINPKVIVWSDVYAIFGHFGTLEAHITKIW